MSRSKWYAALGPEAGPGGLKTQRAYKKLDSNNNRHKVKQGTKICTVPGRILVSILFHTRGVF